MYNFKELNYDKIVKQGQTLVKTNKDEEKEEDMQIDSSTSPSKNSQ